MHSGGFMAVVVTDNGINVELHLISKSPHTSMVITGFLLLQKQDAIKCKIKLCYENLRKYPHPHFVESIINGKMVLFDTWDLCDWNAADWDNEKWGINAIEAQMDNIDFYFKRSYSDEKDSVLSNKNRNKIYPLGFNYHVTHRNNPIDKHRILSYSWIKQTAKKWLFPERLISQYTIDKFEASANYVDAKDLKIIFFTRLWSPNRLQNEQKEEEKRYINRMRIEIIRKLNKLYPNNFYGGIENTDFAQKMCKDIIISNEYSKRTNYLKRMKRSDICIGTMGLHESIGWKTGEYISASRAVVNERLHYKVPGEFKAGENYLSFDTVDECLSLVTSLMDNPDKVYEMKKANERYYHTYLRPDRQIVNDINMVINEPLAKPG
jgi:hypothetical protein